MSRDRAAYMREYRKRKKDPPDGWEKTPQAVMAVAAEHILRLEADRRDLEEEVRHLKAELAKRGGEWTYEEAQGARRTHTGHRDGNPGAASDRFNTRPFTPAPKHK